MVQFTDGSYIMDSKPIAKQLEKLYPEPSLHLDWPKLETILEHAAMLLMTTRPCWMTKVPRNVLTPGSVEYFERTRAERYGMPLEQLEKERDTEERWAEAKPHATMLGDLLRESGGPFFMGKTGKPF
jgi:hypothetical protein